jgi:hypothetical protein
MTMRRVTPLLGLPALLAALALSPAWAADEVKDPDLKYGLELRVRKAGQDDFNEKTDKKYGVEGYVDGNNSNGLYISDTGSVAGIPAKLFKAGGDKVKKPLFQHGLSLAARRHNEKDFKGAKKFGIEVFKDENNGNLVYISEAGGIDAVAAKYAVDTKGKVKQPEHLHGMRLAVRKAGEKDFTKETRRFGLEVFKDENNGNLVYICETGAFATVPGKLVDNTDVAKKVKNPDWQHGLELDVRKAGEAKFTKDTKRYGIEVYLDENNGNLVYICETGDLAVVPAKLAKKTTEKSKSPEILHAMELAVRKAGEGFSDKNKKYNVEVYRDENNANLIYISQTGDLTVIPSKTE